MFFSTTEKNWCILSIHNFTNCLLNQSIYIVQCDVLLFLYGILSLKFLIPYLKWEKMMKEIALYCLNCKSVLLDVLTSLKMQWFYNLIESNHFILFLYGRIQREEKTLREKRKCTKKDCLILFMYDEYFKVYYSFSFQGLNLGQWISCAPQNDSLSLFPRRNKEKKRK